MELFTSSWQYKIKAQFMKLPDQKILLTLIEALNGGYKFVIIDWPSNLGLII